MTNDKLEPMVSLGRRDIAVPVWAVSILNLLFVAAGVYLVTLGDWMPVAAGIMLAIMGVIGLYSIGSGA